MMFDINIRYGRIFIQAGFSSANLRQENSIKYKSEFVLSSLNDNVCHMERTNIDWPTYTVQVVRCRTVF